MKGKLASAAIAALTASPLAAQDAALIIANENYRNADDISAADDAFDVAPVLEDAGFVVRKGADLGAEAMRTLLAEHFGDTGEPGRSVILLSGHFVHADAQTWLVGSGADQPGLASIDAMGLPLSTVLAIAAERPGGALVMLGTEDADIAVGRGLTPGIGSPLIPQGVTLVSGDAATLAEFAGDMTGRRGPTLADFARAATDEDLQVQGFVGTLAAFRPSEDGPVDRPMVQPANPEPEAWATTERIATREAYQAYLDRFPGGAHASEARAALAKMNAPGAQAAATEDSMGMTRDQRRNVQRNLSILDFDPRGIDGVFGPGSRTAIANWQTQSGYEATGYLTPPQLAALSSQADVRARELEAEAAARQAKQDEEDRAYWQQTGFAGDEPGLRAYLKRYPDGLFAELARERLAVFEDARRSEAAASERAAWDKAVAADTVKAYRDYLAAYPEGSFVQEAQQRIAALGQTPEQVAAQKKAQANEAALGLTPAMRQLIEQRLAALEFKPGKVDGVFDEETRRAVRRYQKSRGLPVTGFLNQQTVARLLIDAM